MNLSVLQNFQPSDFYEYPFPYIHIRNALPNDLYRQLAEEYPERALDKSQSYSDFRYYQSNFTPDLITPLWQKFIDFHTSKDYKDQLIKILDPGMRQYYPEITDKYLNSDVCLRHESQPNALKLEIQFVMNSPDAKKIRTPHIDQARELFACLFYMRKEEDKSNGGDLILYEKSSENFEFLNKRKAPTDKIKQAAIVKYEPNTLVAFLNTKNSIHGVTSRVNASDIRRYVNIDGHVDEKLFEL